MGISKSQLRLSDPISLKLNEYVELESTGAIHLNIPLLVNNVDFLPSSFKISINGKILYIDPVVVEDDELADFILITHAHWDHFSKKDIKRLFKKNTHIICPDKVYKKVKKINNANLIKIKPGEILEFDDIKIESTAAYNIKKGLLMAHPEKNMNTGYIIDAYNTRIYHAGDTDYINEIKNLSNITVALIPIDGGNLTMSTDDAATLVNNIKPKYVIPMHYAIESAEMNRLIGSVKTDIKVLIVDGKN